MELKWPFVECEACGYNLREATPKAKEKANDPSNGKPIWTDFCPGCGHGYIVGDRVLPTPPAEVLAEREAAPAMSFVEEIKPEAKGKLEPSGVPPDKRGAALAKTEEVTDPEGLLSKEPVTEEPEDKPEAEAIRPPGQGEYFCTKCATNHRETSKVGARHTKNREA